MVTRGRQRSFLQVLVELREEDPLVAAAIQVEPYGAGHLIAEPDLLDSMLYTVVKGRIQLLCAGPKGRQIAFATLGAGSLFGGGLQAGGTGTPLRAMALTDCTLWVMRGARARALVPSYPVLTWGMLLTVGERLSQVEVRMESLAYRRLPAQLATLLIELANGTRCVRGISHQSMAYMLGTYRETVSAVLRKFKDAGLVSLGYREIELTDLATLQVVAECGA
jgi:CRP/FNR family transcriptional regulator, cyclic AMP receptor protein